jgi:hypothetical protein
MDERLRFVARLLEGEKMARLCAEFGISRKTGYKIFARYKDCGVVAFNDRSRRVAAEPVDAPTRGSPRTWPQRVHIHSAIPSSQHPFSQIE